MTTTDAALAQDIGLARETDYYLMTEQLTEDELGLLYRVRKFAEAEVLPVVNPYWERGEFPFELVPRIAALNIVGDTLVGYGTTPMSAVGAGLLSYELSRVDASDVLCRARRAGDAVDLPAGLGGAKAALAAADGPAGQDRGVCAHRARSRVRRGHPRDHRPARRQRVVINGRQRWPGNAVWCDVIVVFALTQPTGRSRRSSWRRTTPATPRPRSRARSHCG